MPLSKSEPEGLVGKLHADIWWSHDAGDFTSLKTSAKLFLVALGYHTLVAEAAAGHIVEAYSYYDLAVKAPFTKRNYLFIKLTLNT